MASCTKCGEDTMKYADQFRWGYNCEKCNNKFCGACGQVKEGMGIRTSCPYCDRGETPPNR